MPFPGKKAALVFTLLWSILPAGVLLAVLIPDLLAGEASGLNPQGALASSASVASGETVTVLWLADLKARSAVLLRAFEEGRRENAAAVLVGGDLVQQNSPFEFRYAASLLAKAPAGLPVFVTIGNHEGFDRRDNLSRGSYEKTFGKSQSWFLARGVLFVSIDTADEHTFSEEKAREAEAFLRAHRGEAAHAVLLSHVPPLVGKPLVDKRGFTKQLALEDSSRIFALAEKYDVELVLAGHFHGYAEGKRGKTTYLVSGGGGAALDDPDASHHFLKVRLGPAGVTHEVVRVDDGPGLEWMRYQVLRNALFIVPAITLPPLLAGLALLVRARRRAKTA